MKRTQQPGIPQGWTIDIGRGGLVKASSKWGDIVQCRFVPVEGRGLRMRIFRYEHVVDGGYVADRPPVDASWIEDAINDTPGYVLNLLDLQYAEPSPEGGVVPMRLPEIFVRSRRRKPDSFYDRLEVLVQTCQAHGIAFAARIAADNGVSENVVYRWRSEGKRRRQAREQQS